MCHVAEGDIRQVIHTHFFWHFSHIQQTSLKIKIPQFPSAIQGHFNIIWATMTTIHPTKCYSRLNSLSHMTDRPAMSSVSSDRHWTRYPRHLTYLCQHTGTHCQQEGLSHLEQNKSFHICSRMNFYALWMSFSSLPLNTPNVPTVTPSHPSASFTYLSFSFWRVGR